MSSSAAAQEPPARERAPLGERGQLVIADLVGAQSGGGIGSLPGYAVFAPEFTGVLGYQSTSIDGATDPPTSPQRMTSMWLAPSFDVFVADRISVGATATIGNIEVDVQHYFRWGVAPRVGYALPITRDSIAFWPRIGAAYDETIAGSAEGLSQWRAYGYAGFAFRAGTHVLLDVGPTLSYARGTIQKVVDTHSSALGWRATVGLVF